MQYFQKNFQSDLQKPHHRKIKWDIRILSPPPVIRHCPKCGRKTEFISSGRFRVNAQKRALDIWLIYRCSRCASTWNAAVCSRIPPDSLNRELLEGFLGNDSALASSFAADPAFLQRLGVKTGMPVFLTEGEIFSPRESVELEICSPFPLPIKAADLVREKLSLSRREYVRMAESQAIQCVTCSDPLRVKVLSGIRLFFNVEKLPSSIVSPPVISPAVALPAGSSSPQPAERQSPHCPHPWDGDRHR